MDSSRRRFLQTLSSWSACCALLSPGCALLNIDPSSATQPTTLLKPVVPTKDIVDLEVYFVDRRIGDVLIGDGLWNNLYQVSATSPERRSRLQEDGFQFRMAPDRPSRQLQSLIRLSNGTDPSRRVMQQRIPILRGEDSYIAISQVPDGTPLHDGRDEKSPPVVLNQAVTQLRVRAERVEERWAALNIIPEILHGQDALRPVAADNEWRLRQGKEQLTFYDDQMSAELNLGEMLIIGLDQERPGSLAAHFFRSDVSSQIERLIVLRLAGMRRIEGVRESPGIERPY